jgi:hypothetical protein
MPAACESDRLGAWPGALEHPDTPKQFRAHDFRAVPASGGTMRWVLRKSMALRSPRLQLKIYLMHYSTSKIRKTIELAVLSHLPHESDHSVSTGVASSRPASGSCGLMCPLGSPKASPREPSTWGDDAARLFAGPQICDLREQEGPAKMGSATKRLATHGMCSSIGRGYIDRYSVPRDDPE